MSRKAGILLSAVFAILVILWIWTLVVPKDSISIGGSTSVDPLMQRLTNEYKKTSKESFIYASSGSQGGIKNIESNAYKMGFISKEIAADDTSISLVENGKANGLTSDLSDENQIASYLQNTRGFGDQKHKLQIALDAIIIVYHAPTIFNEQFKERFTITIENQVVDAASEELIKLIYDKNPTWDKIATSLSRAQPLDRDQEVIAKLASDRENQLKAFSREPGSGTRNSFEHQMKLDSDLSSTTNSSVLNSNGMMFQEMARASSFGYLSLNYLDAVKEKSDLNLLTIKANGTTYDPSQLEDFTDYPLTRPYIGLFKANLDSKLLNKIAAFIAWMVLAQKDVDSIPALQYKKEGLTPRFGLDGVEYEVNA